MGNEPELSAQPDVLPDEPEQIRQQMEVTREQLAEKVGQLENQISGAVSGAVESVGAAFDIRRHVQDYPLVALGVAVATGFAAGCWLFPSRSAPSRSSRPQRLVEEATASAAPRGESVFGQIANTFLRTAAYELATRAVPQAVDALLSTQARPPAEGEPAAARAEEGVLPFDPGRVEQTVRMST